MLLITLPRPAWARHRGVETLQEYYVFHICKVHIFYRHVSFSSLHSFQKSSYCADTLTNIDGSLRNGSEGVIGDFGMSLEK